MYHSHTRRLPFLAILTIGLTHCVRGPVTAEKTGSLTMEVPQLPAELKDVPVWTFDLYCAASKTESEIRKQLIASTDAESEGKVTFQAADLLQVQEGWSCLLDMSTDKPVKDITDAKLVPGSKTKKLYFSSAPTPVTAKRELPVKLRPRYTPANATPVTLTVTRKPSNARESLTDAGTFKEAEFLCDSGFSASPATPPSPTDGAQVTLLLKLSPSLRAQATCKVKLTYEKKIYQSQTLAAVGTQDKVALEAEEVATAEAPAQPTNGTNPKGTDEPKPKAPGNETTPGDTNANPQDPGPSDAGKNPASQAATGNTEKPTPSGGSVPTPPSSAEKEGLLVIGDGAAVECPLGTRFNYDPEIFTCQ